MISLPDLLEIESARRSMKEDVGISINSCRACVYTGKIFDIFTGKIKNDGKFYNAYDMHKIARISMPNCAGAYQMEEHFALHVLAFQN